jgi:hypothetical protein
VTSGPLMKGELSKFRSPMTPALNLVPFAPKRCWSFSLRTLFVVVTVATILCVVSPPSLRFAYQQFLEPNAARKQRLWLERHKQRFPERPGASEFFEAPQVEAKPGPPVS